jgi:hypothetical protein
MARIAPIMSGRWAEKRPAYWFACSAVAWARSLSRTLPWMTCTNLASSEPPRPSTMMLAGLSGMEREYIRDRTLEGRESARARGKAIGGAAVTDDAMLGVALHLRSQELSIRDIAARLVISTGKKKGQHASPATVMRMLREHGEKAAATDVTLIVR